MKRRQFIALGAAAAVAPALPALPVTMGKEEALRILMTAAPTVNMVAFSAMSLEPIYVMIQWSDHQDHTNWAPCNPPPTA